MHSRWLIKLFDTAPLEQFSTLIWAKILPVASA